MPKTKTGAALVTGVVGLGMGKLAKQSVIIVKTKFCNRRAEEIKGVGGVCFLVAGSQAGRFIKC